MFLRQVVVEGLGHISALLADDVAKVAAVVDPRRDIDVYLYILAERDLRLTHVLETHLHNDYVSGARELAERTGAIHVAPAGAELAFEHLPLRDGESVDVGSLRFLGVDTPGHTPEHVSYSVADRTRADEPALLFTGGSLLVGAVGRTDLLGTENAEPYARLMHASLHERLLRHEDHVTVLPTHGGGSLCSKAIATTPWTTMGYERRHNGMLGIADVDEFVCALLADQPAYPRYFGRMRGINQSGPAPLGSVPEPHPLPLARFEELMASGHLVVDLRPPADFALSHIPGAISIPAGDSFGTWLGWVVEHDRPLLFVLRGVGEWDQSVRQALRIGYDGVAGHLHGGFAAWEGAGRPLEASGGATVGQLRAFLDASRGVNGRGPLVLDVRQLDEYASGHVPGAIHLMAGDLPDRLGDLPRNGPVMVICASGYRSSVASSLLKRAGFEDVTWVSGGVPAWSAAGYPVEQGGPTER